MNNTTYDEVPGSIEMSAEVPDSSCDERTKLVLSVEDNDGAYLLLQMAFKEVGGRFTLCRAVHGEEALTLLRARAPDAIGMAPDLILLDLRMPRMGGTEVLQALREDPSLNHIPTVVLTCSRSESERQTCLALGAKDFISKPLRFVDLVEALKVACAFAA